jgi:membrane protein
MWRIVKKTVADFSSDDCMSLGGALAFYTMFSLPSLLLIVTGVAGLVFGSQQVQQRVVSQMGQLAGPQAADQVRTVLANQQQQLGGGLLPTVVGIVVLFVGATGVVSQLQASLNKIWDVQPDSQQGGVWRFITKRILSFGMLLAIAFLLLVSLAVSTALAAVGDRLGGMVGGDVAQPLLLAVNFVISLVVVTLLFAAMYKVLPDAEVAWRDVWVGALITAILFTVGKFLIGLYLGNTNVGSAYGAAGSLVVVLVWVYYSSLILFLGAEFTKVWADERGAGLKPVPGAVSTETPAAREPAAPVRWPGGGRPRPA